ncbi:MAG: threonine/serine exporter family protein [Spirochaetales bacterium]|nr:threonine/serine exporter family protein [Spirochaetales bacterium]
MSSTSQEAGLGFPGEAGDEVVRIAARAGRMMLENGGETNRAQDTVNTLCLKLGMAEADSFATPTGLMLSGVDRQGRSFSSVTRVTRRVIDLEKVTRISELARNAGGGSLESRAVQRELDRIAAARQYVDAVKIAVGAATAGCCTLLFGGGWREALATIPVGALVKLLSILLAKVHLNDFFINIVGGMLAAVLASAAAALGLAIRADPVIIGAIMLLIPGITMVNAIRDTIAGDLVAGISRTVEAVIVAVAIAIGTGLGVRLWALVAGGS